MTLSPTAELRLQLFAALARGYCSPENSGKAMDSDLIGAQVEELVAVVADRLSKSLNPGLN